MKPAAFEYLAPQSLEEALAALREHGEDAKVLAGGQSLVPAMNFRLAQPAVLVDINRVDELSHLEPRDDGGLTIGALTRQRQVERSELVAERAPLVHVAMPFIAHAQIRNRGTFGGSVAHADPAAELPAVCLALDASFRLQSLRGSRSVKARDFYRGLFDTALEPDELLVEIELPATRARTGIAFHEFARRHGDFALVGVAVSVTLDAEGRCADARIALLSVGETAVEASGAAAVLRGRELDRELAEEAARVAASEDIDPPSDLHASVEYRRHLTRVLTRRALEEAGRRAADVG